MPGERTPAPEGGSSQSGRRPGVGTGRPPCRAQRGSATDARSM